MRNLLTALAVLPVVLLAAACGSASGAPDVPGVAVWVGRAEVTTAYVPTPDGDMVLCATAAAGRTGNTSVAITCDWGVRR